MSLWSEGRTAGTLAGMRAGSDLRRCDLRRASLAGANLRGCRLDDGDLREADLWGANLALASLRRADLRGARLSCASLAGADLRGAKLAGCELVLCDLGGALLACVDLGRPRRGRLHDFAASRGFASFADALEPPALEASSMMPGRALLAVDAALDVTADPDMELDALLRDADWRVNAIGTLAVARRGTVGRNRDALVALLSRNEHTASSAAVALLASGAPAETVAARRPSLVGPSGWCDAMHAKLERVRAWPAVDAPIDSLLDLR